MLKEKNYDFRLRHWTLHRPGMRQADREAGDGEIALDENWRLGCAVDAPEIIQYAVRDFQDYLLRSQDLSLPVTRDRNGDRVLWVESSGSVAQGFTLDVAEKRCILDAASPEMTFRGTIHLEDIMSLEGAPVLPLGKLVRIPMYKERSVHSGAGIDDYRNEELVALLHAGYDAINVMIKDFDVTASGPCNINDIIQRAKFFGIRVDIYNYMQTFHHPDEEGVQKIFDDVYGELFRRYPGADQISLCGESLEFPSKDPHTTGKPFNESVVDGIPETRPSPGWYPCEDYPAYLQCIERAVHKVKPSAEVLFETYNWGYAPLELRRDFIGRFPKNVMLSVCFEIFSKRKLEGLRTPVMDYTMSAQEPGEYFATECECARQHGIEIVGNVNTAGIAWDWGCVPLVPAPKRLVNRVRRCREACVNWGVTYHYTTHHYGWCNTVAADIGKWGAWKDFEPDYGELLRKVALRDYGKEAAQSVLDAWDIWNQAMEHYIASNEDQYGPWRVGSAYPFIFQPNITRTLQGKEIKFPTNPHAHFGSCIIRTLYQPYENEDQAPGFMRYPAEIRSLEAMLALWNQGLERAREAVKLASEAKRANAERLEALGHFIRNSVRTTIHIKQWWLKNMALQISQDQEAALAILDELRDIAAQEIEIARDTIPAVETDSRIGWEPSMEYVCDRWHLEWKIRQVESALREIDQYEQIIRNARADI